MSPSMWPSAVTKQVAASSGDGHTDEIPACGGRPDSRPVTLVHVLPPSRVTCTLPSSVPAQTTLVSCGDSAIA